MKCIDYIEDNFPDYALSYVVNGDSSGIETEDQENCDAWLERLTSKLRRDYPDAVSIDLLFEDGEPSFHSCPAFGLACNTVQCAVCVFVENEDSRPKIALPWEEEEEEEEEERAGCDSCSALMIQGVFCHETGCPNARHECKGCNALIPHTHKYCADCA